VIEATNSAIYRTGDIAIDDLQLIYGTDCSGAITTRPPDTVPTKVNSLVSDLFHFERVLDKQYRDLDHAD